LSGSPLSSIQVLCRANAIRDSLRSIDVKNRLAAISANQSPFLSPKRGFNTLKTLSYLQNSNETGNTLSSADGSRCALLGNYTASSLVTIGNRYGGMTAPNEWQWGSQSLLACPHRA
jgi:hypothetical protein